MVERVVKSENVDFYEGKGFKVSKVIANQPRSIRKGIEDGELVLMSKVEKVVVVPVAKVVKKGKK